MTNERAALGGILKQLVDLEVTEFCSEPLDAIVERRLKTVWTSRACPDLWRRHAPCSQRVSPHLVRTL